MEMLNTKRRQRKAPRATKITRIIREAALRPLEAFR